MGRAGAGGGGGGHSGGGHSSGRSSGGHHVSGGSSGRRAGSGGSRGSYGGFGGPSYGGGFYGGGFYPRPPRRSTIFIGSGGGINAIVSLLIFKVIIITAFAGFPSSNSTSTKGVPKRTQNRERLESGEA